MRVSIHDRDALLAVSPAALSAYARNAGWRQHEAYREHSDIYIGDALPEIIVPRTPRLGDYASAVAALIGTFAQIADQDELTVYRWLVTADRDVIRIRAAESDDGSLGLNDGVKLVNGARDMVLSAACSLQEPRPVYRAGANREATALLRRMRFGQTDQGSFVVTLLTPVVLPPMPALFEYPDDSNAPVQRRMTKRLVEALAAARQAAERAGSGDGNAFGETVASGVSANLCESLVQIVEPFSALDVGVSWARTRPMGTCRGRSCGSDSRMQRCCVRPRAPSGSAHRSPTCVSMASFASWSAREEDAYGTIGLRTEVDGQRQSVLAVLEQADYERAVQAHKDRAPVVLKGELERAPVRDGGC